MTVTALLQTGESRLDRVITGLPVNQYLNTKLRRSLVERLQGKHQVHDQQVIDVGEVIVLLQPVGAYLDLVRNGLHLDLIEQGRVVVIDPGFFSVDWVALERGAIRHASSGTSLEAVPRVLELAAAQLSRDYDITTGINRLERATLGPQNNNFQHLACIWQGLVYGKLIAPINYSCRSGHGTPR